jgi:hypothetical protein
LCEWLVAVLFHYPLFVHVQERVKQEKRTRPPRMRSILREK